VKRLREPLPAWWLELPWQLRMLGIMSASFAAVWIPFSLLFLWIGWAFTLSIWLLFCLELLLVTWIGRRLLVRRGANG
jgi:hypothetical protein